MSDFWYSCHMKIDQKESLSPPLQKPIVFEKENIDYEYERIDKNIKELIRRLNKIPFVSTVSSCEGHLKDHLNVNISDRGCMFIMPGHIIFNMDKTNSQWQVFLGKVNKLVKKYPFAEINVHHCENEGCRIEGAQCLDLNVYDLTHPETIVGTDSLETMEKKRYQVKIPIGKGRINEFHRFWSKLDKIAGEFSK